MMKVSESIILMNIVISGSLLPLLRRFTDTAGKVGEVFHERGERGDKTSRLELPAYLSSLPGRCGGNSRQPQQQVTVTGNSPARQPRWTIVPLLEAVGVPVDVAVVPVSQRPLEGD